MIEQPAQTVYTRAGGHPSRCRNEERSRTEDEIKERHRIASIYCKAEATEYERQIGDAPESWREIDRTAKLYLDYFLRHISRGRHVGIRTAIAQFVAWKWLLGHTDADTFHGAHDEPVDFNPRTTYLYLKHQIEGGEWDRMTNAALQTAALQTAGVGETI